MNKGVIVLKRATLYTVSALMTGALTFTGCGRVSANANITNASHGDSSTQSQTTLKSNHSANISSQPIKTGGYGLNNSTSQGECIGSLYSVLGKIDKVNQNQSVIQSIQLTVIKSTTANRIEPLQRGKSYIIYFDQPKSELHSLQLKNRTYIDITFSQFIRYSDPKKRTIPAHAGWVWGSNFDWVKALGVSISPKTIIEKSYPSSTEATDAITNLEPNNGQFYPSGSAVNLGLGIKAEFYGGAGQYGFKWNEGRWIVLTQFSGNDATGTKLVKEIVAYLHTHMLPVPENKGVIIIQQTGSSTLKVTQNTIAWQVGNKIYQLQQTDDPIRALQIVVNSNKG